MKKLALRTQVLFVILFIWLYGLGAGISYWLQERSHDRLEASFHRQLAMLTRLPRLRDDLRQLDLVTDNYLLGGNAQWLSRREETLSDIHALEKDLPGQLSGRELAIFQGLDASLTSYLAEQSQWISRKRAGRLLGGEAVTYVKRGKVFNGVIDRLIALNDADIDSLDRQQASEHRFAKRVFLLIIFTGLLAGAFIAFFLSRYLVSPVAGLQRYAQDWKLGEKWELPYPPPSPEMEALFNTLAEMTRRLNEQYEKEQELVKLKTKLVSMVSHEFNNTLSVISGVSMLLKENDGKNDPAKRRQNYAVLDSHVRALALTSHNILDMARLETGHFAIKPRPMELRPLIEEAVKRLDVLSARKEQTVSVNLPDGPVNLFADPEALGLVIGNLLSNAIKYTPDKGSIAIGFDKERGSTTHGRLSVQDTGIGISDEDKERLFSAFFRAESGKRVAKGFGVGLSLASNVVEAHGSRLEVDSEPGKGSRFSFLLPFSA